MSNNLKSDKTITKVIKTMDKNELLEELLKKQIKNIPKDNKLSYIDLRRVCKFIPTSIFDDNQCCIWNSYITNENNCNKGSYINFYFRRKKAALHRLLYSNFVGELDKTEYLKFNCENKGRCCTVSHLRKFKYNKVINEDVKEAQQKKVKTTVKKEGTAIVNKDKLHISFDL
jgi:hypothetical protein